MKKISRRRNDSKDKDKHADAGVDAITTDWPDIAIRTVA
jgi:glycerophosphoryl diester phosphodiesterase